MSHLQPPNAQQVHRSAHVSNILSKCTHVFVQYDAVKKPLQQPYDGPFKVIERVENILQWITMVDNQLFTWTD